MTNLELINKLETLEDVHKAEAHVIQCNDMVVCVVIGSEEDVAARMEVEREAYFQENKHVLHGNHCCGPFDEDGARKAAKSFLRFHIRTVPLH